MEQQEACMGARSSTMSLIALTQCCIKQRHGQEQYSHATESDSRQECASYKSTNMASRHLKSMLNCVAQNTKIVFLLRVLHVIDKAKFSIFVHNKKVKFQSMLL